MSIRRILGSIKNQINPAVQPSPGPFLCPVCKMQTKMAPLPTFYFRELQKYQYIHNIFLTETLNLEHYSCEQCGACDRDRLFVLFLDRYLSSKKSINLLDIAPSAALAKWIRSYSSISYRSMDLFMEEADDHFDITDMSGYADGQFDFFICSHVLEHIPNDRRAIRELYRVLKPGGTGITMVPINLALEQTLEDPSITDIAGRWKYFGQDDHVRMYAKNDFVSRLESAGFKLTLLDINYFGAEAYRKAAVYPTSVLYVVSK